MCGAILFGGMIAVSAYALLQIMAGGGSLAWMCLPTSYFLFLLALYILMQRRQNSVVLREDPDVVEAESVEDVQGDYSGDPGLRFKELHLFLQYLKLLIWLRNATIVLAILWVILKIISLYLQYYY